MKVSLFYNNWIKQIAIILFALILLFLFSCKKCETKYEPDFTEDEFSWVNFEDSEPTYFLKYWDRINDKWLYDTVIGNRIPGYVWHGKKSEGKCKDNVRYSIADSNTRIYSEDRKGGFYEFGIQIKKLENFTVYIKSFKKTIYSEKEIRSDSITIGNYFYNDVYIDNNHEISFVYSKKYGLVHIFNRIDSTEAMLIPEL